MDNICFTCLSNHRRLYPIKDLISLIQELNLNEVAIKLTARLMVSGYHSLWTLATQGVSLVHCQLCGNHSLEELTQKFCCQYRPDGTWQQNFNMRSTELQNSEGSMCWECHSAIMKFQKFRIQAKRAQEIMRQNVKFDEIKPLSTLIYTTKHIYDYEFNFDIPNSEIENKDKFVSIFTEDTIHLETKDELKTIKQEITDSADDFDTVINDIDIIDTNKRKVKRKDAKKRKSVHRKSKTELKEVDKFETKVFTEEEMMKNREEKRNHPNFKKIPFKCDSCVLGFTRKETYDIHVEKKHDEGIGKHICDVCQTRFPTAKSCQRHKSKHYILHTCTLCKYETRALWSVELHCRTKHRRDTRGSIHCVQCRTLARTPEDMAEHIRTEHTLHCNECGEKFKGKNTLRTHKARIHAVQRDYICDICSKTFVTKTRLESHMVTHNSSIAKNLSYCTICKVQYKNIYVYRSHLKNSANHSERAYPCPECNKKFASKVYWTKHYNFYHLHKSEFSCEICNKLFISDWRLKNHRQKHHGLNRSRDHPCNICGKKFFTVSTLVGHQLTHSTQRSYMCEECGDTFKQRPALYTHARLVHRVTKR